MPRRHIRVTGAPEAPLRAALTALRKRLGAPAAFPLAVLAEAERVAKTPSLPSYDATDIPFLTLDPPARRPPPPFQRVAARPPLYSTDLDQALHLSRQGAGYRVRYAIADVAAFVVPGGRLDVEAHSRVNTLYFPDGKVPLHPAVLSEGAASLLPGHDRPAALWTVDLDADGRTVAVDVRRALVRSRAKLDYAGVQQQIDAGTAEEPIQLISVVGKLREGLEAERGGISLDVPEQEVVEHDDSYELTYRAPLPAEGWNAQLSLLTGMAAADLMLASGTGVLRTLPAAPGGAVGRLRRTAHALHIDWPHHVSYAQLIRSLDPHDHRHAAFLQECTSLLRGAGYTVFRDGSLPAITTHAAVAAPYAHCTAPLRRLADRHATELCLAAVAGHAPPDWVLAVLDALPKEMAEGGRRANAVERGCVDIVEAALLKDRVGEVFDGYVVDVDEHRPTVGTVQLESPAVIGRVDSGDGGESGEGGEGGTPLPLGERLRVRLKEADPTAPTIRFAPA
ncbi:RNB domain-containing ribonuclease [Streptomyces sp. NPDC051677]|uniref:RNB domain-containing ribonuclease n=1 Tax=Streptomyces sp. NPDC051677 TaxID=3365669 RepID=UPI0037D84515